jgi:hypothetical protein
MNNKFTELMGKFLDLLGSRRFWLILLGGVMVWLQDGDWKLAVLGVVSAIISFGTIDKFTPASRSEIPN